MHIHRLGLIIIFCVSAGLVHAEPHFCDLANELDRSSSLETQRQLVAELRQLLPHAPPQADRVGAMIYRLSRQPVFARKESVDLLRELAAIPALTEAVMVGISNQFVANRSYGTATTQAMAEMLRTFDARDRLPDRSFATLGRSLGFRLEKNKRRGILDVLMATPVTDERYPEVLEFVSQLLDQRIPLDERLEAFAIVKDAAKTRTLPHKVISALGGLTLKEQHSPLRIAAWPFVIDLPRERIDYHSFGFSLTRQLAPPHPAFEPVSFWTSDERTRERAVAHVTDYWRPRFPDQFIDALIELVREYESPASIAALREIRLQDDLSDRQLASLAQVAEGLMNARRRDNVREIVIPNLAPGSLMNPLLTVEFSGDEKERAEAANLLLAQNAEGPVPMQVAEAAYQVLRRSVDFSDAAGELVARGDEDFDVREAKLLALLKRKRRNTHQLIDALAKLHGDASIEVLVLRYVPDRSIVEIFRASIISAYTNETKAGKPMSPEVQKVLLEAARSAKNYSTIASIDRAMRIANLDVPISVRIKHRDVHWKIMSRAFYASLTASAIAAVIVVFQLFLTPAVSGVRLPRCWWWFGGWIALFLSTGVAAMAAVIASIGHNSLPSPKSAFPHYLPLFMLAMAQVALALWLIHLNKRQRRTALAR